jgi:hypothetical protein
MIQQIVANNLVLKQFSKIDIFKRELGENLTGAVSGKGKDRNLKIQIKDDFIQRYNTNTKHLIFRYGVIGSLVFYQDTSLENNEFVAFEDNKIYEIEIESLVDFRNNPRNYLSEVIGKINNNEETGSTDNEDYMVITTVPESIEIPDISLPKDQYVNEMIERRKNISGNGKQ